MADVPTLKIYVTHCSAKKNPALRETQELVSPDLLYKALPLQRFINTCKERQVKWAIFSDLYGIWFPDIRHEWYEKHPKDVTESEFHWLVNDFDEKLRPYDEIWFYRNPGRFHSLYRRLLKKVSLRSRVTLFSHISEIE